MVQVSDGLSLRDGWIDRLTKDSIGIRFRDGMSSMSLESPNLRFRDSSGVALTTIDVALSRYAGQPVIVEMNTASPRQRPSQYLFVLVSLDEARIAEFCSCSFSRAIEIARELRETGTTLDNLSDAEFGALVRRVSAEPKGS